MNNQSAAFLGRRAGLLTLAPSLCPYPDGSVLAAEWHRGRQSAEAEVNQYADQKARKDWWASQNDDGWIYAGRTSSRGNP